MGYDKFYRKIVSTDGVQINDGIISFSSPFTASNTPISLANPLGVPLIIEECIVYVGSPSSTTPGTINVGCNAAGALSSSDNLIDGAAVGCPVAPATEVVRCINSADDGGTNGQACRRWATSTYLTMSVASGTPAGLACEIYLRYRKA